MSGPSPVEDGSAVESRAGGKLAQRLLALLAVLAALGAMVVVVGGGTKSLGLLIFSVACLAVTLAAIWWFLSHRGVIRWLAAGLALATPVVLVALFIVRDLLWAVLLAGALLAIAAVAGQAAIRRTDSAAGMPERTADPPRRPFVIMNPRSGGGKVARFELDSKAVARGAQVALIEGPGEVDVAGMARHALAEGADLLGVAGGDGTQALVAGIAADCGVPFLVISAGTRNHFALDLGLDRDRPDLGLGALTDGVELRLDLGLIGGRTFVNNTSFGAYAAVVQNPAYRDDKRGTALQMLPDLLAGESGPLLTVQIDDQPPIVAPKAVLVSNNPYGSGELTGLGRRPRLDTGMLGVIAVTVENAAQFAELLRGQRASGIRRFVAHEVVVDADAEEIAVGIDGEAVMMRTPVHCSIRPLALRVRVPRGRPGVPLAVPRLDRILLQCQALAIPRRARPRDRASQ